MPSCLACRKLAHSRHSLYLSNNIECLFLPAVPEHELKGMSIGYSTMKGSMIKYFGQCSNLTPGPSFAEGNFPTTRRAEGAGQDFRMIPRHYTFCHHWSDKRGSSAGNASDEGQPAERGHDSGNYCEEEPQTQTVTPPYTRLQKRDDFLRRQKNKRLLIFQNLAVNTVFKFTRLCTILLYGSGL